MGSWPCRASRYLLLGVVLTLAAHVQMLPVAGLGGRPPAIATTTAHGVPAVGAGVAGSPHPRPQPAPEHPIEHSMCLTVLSSGPTLLWAPVTTHEPPSTTCGTTRVAHDRPAGAAGGSDPPRLSVTATAVLLI